MRNISLVFILAVSFVSCSVSTGSDVVTVRGAKYSYEIPIKYVYNKDRLSSFFSSDEKERFDRAGSLLLEVEKSMNGQPISILILLYKDKIYPDNHLQTSLTTEYDFSGLLDDVQFNNGIYVAYKEYNDPGTESTSTQTYFSTINPSRPKDILVTDDDFYGDRMHSNGLENIPGVVIRDLSSCNFKILNDGLLYHSSFPGDACKIESVHEFKELHDKLILEWRVSKS